ncbi:hypothetical protein U9M48_028950 [Paspalum notatum var. saurae]|uniref:Heat shock factor binding protein n=1 Tax=Paspalum notatum var. saurae TaxID=547442 RepID=A0AAQ3X298_PASNO
MASPNSGIPVKVEQDSDGSAQSTADMTAFVMHFWLMVLSSPTVSGAKPSDPDDEMGVRIDELEQSINDLKAGMGSEVTSPSKMKQEPKPSDSSA